MKRLRLVCSLVLLLAFGQTGQAQVTEDTIYDQAQKHTVRLFQSLEGYPTHYSAICTAVLIDKQQDYSLLLTAGHCVDNASSTYLVVSDKSYFVVKKYISSYTDLALLFVAGSIGEKEPAPFSAHQLCAGEKLYSFAYPGADTFQKTGEFLGLDWYRGSVNFVVIPGCSGSGIYNGNGELEGIVVSYDKYKPVSYYIPIHEFYRFLHQLDVDGEMTKTQTDQNETRIRHLFDSLRTVE
jgi:S1-C subfamily serine protease